MNEGDAAGKHTSNIFRDRNFQLLWTGNTTSNIGLQAVRIAYPFVTLLLTRSPVLAGCASFAMMAPCVLFGIHSGIAADYGDRRRILQMCQRIGLIATLLAAVAVALRPPGIWLLLLLVAAFVEGTAQTFFAVSEVAFVRNIVNVDDRPAAYSFLEIENRLVRMVGQIFGHVAISIARSLPFLANAVSYLYCLWSLSAIRDKASDQAKIGSPDRSRLWELNQPWAGLQIVLTNPFLSGTTAILAAANAIFEVVPLQITLEMRDSGRPVATIGLVLGAVGLGGVVGSLGAKGLADRFGVTVILTWSLRAWTVLLVPIALQADPAVLALCWAGIGAVAAVSALAMRLCQLRLIPDHLLGRTEGAMAVAADVGTAGGALLSGVALWMFGTSMTGWILVITMVILARRARRLREPQTLTTRPSDTDQTGNWIARIATDRRN